MAILGIDFGTPHSAAALRGDKARRRRGSGTAAI
jgi:hypothetical protein